MTENLSSISRDVFTLLDRDSRGRLSLDAMTYLAQHTRLPLSNHEVLDIFLKHASAASGVYLTMDNGFVGAFVELCEISATPAGRVWQLFTDDQLRVVFTACADATGRSVVRQTVMQLFHGLVRRGDLPADETYSAALLPAASTLPSASCAAAEADVSGRLVTLVPDSVVFHAFFDLFRRGWPHLSKPYLVAALLKVVNDQGLFQPMPRMQDRQQPGAVPVTAPSQLGAVAQLQVVERHTEANDRSGSPYLARATAGIRPSSLLRSVGSGKCAGEGSTTWKPGSLGGSTCAAPLEIQVEVLKTAVMELQNRLRGSEQVRDRLTEMESEVFVLREALELAQEEYRSERLALVAVEEECDKLRAANAAQSQEVEMLRDRVKELTNTLDVAAFEVQQTNSINATVVAAKGGVSELQQGSASSGVACTTTPMVTVSYDEELFGALKVFIERKEADVTQREEAAREETRKLSAKEESLRVWEELLQRKQEDLVLGEVEAKRRWAEVFHGDEVQLQTWREKLELRELDLVQREAEVQHRLEQLDQREQQIESISLPERQRRMEMLRQIEAELGKREHALRQRETSYLDGLVHAELTTLRNENRILLRTVTELRAAAGDNGGEPGDRNSRAGEATAAPAGFTRASPTSYDGVLAAVEPPKLTGLVTSPTDSFGCGRTAFSHRLLADRPA